jgi:hypothetical protein
MPVHRASRTVPGRFPSVHRSMLTANGRKRRLDRPEPTVGGHVESVEWSILPPIGGFWDARAAAGDRDRSDRLGEPFDLDRGRSREHGRPTADRPPEVRSGRSHGFWTGGRRPDSANVVSCAAFPCSITIHGAKAAPVGLLSPILVVILPRLSPRQHAISVDTSPPNPPLGTHTPLYPGRSCRRSTRRGRAQARPGVWGACPTGQNEHCCGREAAREALRTKF